VSAERGPGTLPPGTELNVESLDRPREIFRSQAIGEEPYFSTRRPPEYLKLRRLALAPALTIKLKAAVAFR
jgi:hypothetical protein